MDIKQMCNPKKILTINSRGLNAFPVSIEIQPTNLCNLSCEYCSYRNRKVDECSLSEKVFNELIESVLKMKVSAVYFSGGGEPTLYPFLQDAVKVLHQNNIKVAIITNGSQFDTISEIVNHCAYILVNIATDGNVQAQKKARNLAKKLKNQGELQDCLIGARLVVTKKNSKDIEKIIGELLNNNFDYIQCTPAVNYVEGDLCLDENDLDSIYNSPIFGHPLVMLAEKNTGNHTFTNKCHSIENRLHAIITADSKVNICPPLSRCEEIGDLNLRDLLNIWNNHQHRVKVEEINSDYCETSCKYCRFLSYNKILAEMDVLKKNPHAVFI